MEKSTREHGGTAGHRQRLRERFLAGDTAARDDVALLELLLTYAIPQRDVAPLAHSLLTEFHDLSGVLAAQPSQLLRVAGIKENSATLLKLVDHIRRHYAGDALEGPSGSSGQLPLFDGSPIDAESKAKQAAFKAVAKRKATPPVRPRSDLFANPVLQEAIDLLPNLPETESLEDTRAFLRRSLPQNSQQTRVRFAELIVKRMFSLGSVDQAMRMYARQYAGRQELRDACYYRFCVAEPLMFSIAEDLLFPNIGSGQLERRQLLDYLTARFPGFKSIGDSALAISKGLTSGGIARANKTGLSFAYRDILLPSFAFVLHSEFPEPGMYDIAKLERNRAVRALLWNPDRILPALYELRNRGILSKVSEIDSVRQFTTCMTLDQVVEALAAEGSRV